MKFLITAIALVVLAGDLHKRYRESSPESRREIWRTRRSILTFAFAAVVVIGPHITSILEHYIKDPDQISAGEILVPPSEARGDDVTIYLGDRKSDQFFVRQILQDNVFRARRVKGKLTLDCDLRGPKGDHYLIMNDNRWRVKKDSDLVIDDSNPNAVIVTDDNGNRLLELTALSAKSARLTGAFYTDRGRCVITPAGGLVLQGRPSDRGPGVFIHDVVIGHDGIRKRTLEEIQPDRRGRSTRTIWLRLIPFIPEPVPFLAENRVRVLITLLPPQLYHHLPVWVW